MSDVMAMLAANGVTVEAVPLHGIRLVTATGEPVPGNLVNYAKRHKAELLHELRGAVGLDELEEMDLGAAPVCQCGRDCDIETADDQWHCSKCDPDADRRRELTQRLIRRAERIRGQK